MPIFAQVGLLQKLTGLIYFPITPTVPALRACSAARATCRRSSASASWSRSRPTSGARSRGTTRGSCRRSPRRSARASRRSSTTCSPTAARSGSDEAASSSPACRPTGAAGSRRSSSATPTSRRSSASPPTTRRCALERTEFVRVGTQHALLRRIVHAAEIDTVDRHAPGRRLARPRRPRVAHEHERDRDDEHPRGVRRAGLAGAQGRLQVLRALLRLRARRPGFFTEDDAAPAPAAHAAGGRHRRGRGRRRGLRRRATRTSRSPRCASATALGPDLRTSPHRAARPARRPGHPRLRPALPVHPRGRHRRRAAPRGRATTCPAIYNAAPDGVLALSEVAACSASRSRRCCRRGGRRSADRADAAARRPVPDEVRQQLRYGRGLDNRKLKQARLPLRAHDARDGAGVRRGAAPRSRCARAARRHTATSARSRSSCAGRRACVATSQPADAPACLQGFRVRRRASYHLREPDAYSSDRSRCLRGCLVGVGVVAGAYVYDHVQAGPDRRGREGQRRRRSAA